MTDRYVIVYRFGVLGSERDKTDSDRLVSLHMNNVDPESRPAYRIRIREKAARPIKSDAPLMAVMGSHNGQSIQPNTVSQ